MFKKITIIASLVGLALTPSLFSDGLKTAEFTPPEGWRFAEAQSLPANVKVMVVGKGKKEYPPSINLATEPFTGSLKEYLKIVKAINESQGSSWKDLGTIQTSSGNASLSQLDTKTEWGDVHMMHVIKIQDGIAYILTAASLKEEFPKYYKVFFNAMRSLKINANKAALQ